MYCPNCAAPIDGAKFFRYCGANVSLVPQALNGQFPIEDSGRRHGRRRKSGTPTIEKAASSFFTGIGFLLVSLAVAKYAPAGQIWWFWMLIPAFACIGEGVGTYLKLREAQRQQQLSPPQFQSPVQPAQISPQPAAAQIAGSSAPTTSELAPPASITEHTTKHLGKS
jgi:hypothetical protein